MIRDAIQRNPEVREYFKYLLDRLLKPKMRRTDTGACPPVLILSACIYARVALYLGAILPDRL